VPSFVLGGRRLESVPITGLVDYDAVVALETHQLELAGVSRAAGPLRAYPVGPGGGDAG
jgi:hypothetical protein